jgi:hypothetical protein
MVAPLLPLTTLLVTQLPALRTLFSDPRPGRRPQGSSPERRVEV